jgi:6-phosphogluconolactonase
MGRTVKVFNNNEEIAKFLGDKLKELSTRKEKINVALSGGNTPKAIFDLWSREYKTCINWQNIVFFWGDERCVPPSHPDSNYGMTYSTLLSKIDIPEENIARVKGELDPSEATEEYIKTIEQRVPFTNGIPRFDIVFLGMGDDGHTVSIFPHQIGLWNSSRTCETAIHPVSGQHRVTITGKVINNASEAIFLVTGKGKKSVADEILNGKGNYKSYPASLVNNPNTTWLTDTEAVPEELP